MANYPWYECIKAEENDFTQGDILVNCPIVRLTSIIEDGERDVVTDIEYATGIVMTQACDIANNKTDTIILCPLISIDDFIDSKEQEPNSKITSQLDIISKGQSLSFMLLDHSCLDDFSQDYSIVDFCHAFSLPVTVVRKLAERSIDRLRLLPPYREAVSQAFARYFMRIGLPTNTDGKHFKSRTSEILSTRTMPPITP